jgi:hypothetical protein
MRNRLAVSLVTLLLVVGTGVTPSARAADDPNSGTWRLNLAKSRFNPGPAPKAIKVETIKIENDTETYNSERLDASGNTTLETYSAKLDGTETPVAGVPYADTISTKRMAPNHLVSTFKKGGMVTMTVNIVVATGGMSRTVTYTGKNERGQKVHNVLMFDKQM